MSRSTRVSVALAAALGAVLFVVLPGQGAMAGTTPGSTGTPRPAHPAPTPAVPGLSISVSDGRTAAKAGDLLTYVVHVRDGGTAAAPHLKITQTLSPGLAFVSASSHGVATAGKVAWDASIPAGRAQTFSVVARVTQTPARVLRLAAVACAAAEGSKTPDRLRGPPRPVACRHGRVAIPGRGPGAGSLLVYTLAGLAGLAVLAAALIAGRRVRLRRQAA